MDTAQQDQNGPQQTSLSSAKWLEQVKVAEANQQKFWETGRKITKRFLDKRDASGESQNKLNLFTSNVSILIATLYARFPKPLVTRQFEDESDDIARVAGNIMERMLSINPRDCFDSAMRLVVQDRLVPGVGTIWFRYCPTFEPRQSEAVLHPTTGEVLVEAQTYDEKVDEYVETDYVFWEDILWSPCRTWEQMRWVGRRVRMTKEDATKRFGELVAGQLNYKRGQPGHDRHGQDGEAPEDNSIGYADIYELWDKRSKTVVWVSKGFDKILDQRPDMLKLPGFFPTPRFLTALMSSSNFMPRADYLLGQDQYEELDMINDRITKIERAIKVVGVYDGTNSAIERIFEEGTDNKLIPNRSFSEFMEKGGFKGAIDWLPIEAMVNALERLREYRQDLIQQIYEVYGISDIMRGSTKASETLGAQQLKAQYGSIKLQFLQMEVAAFVEEALQIKAEIIRNFYDIETIIRESNIMNSNDAQFAQQAIQLIKSPEFKYRVEVHADSMAVPEFNAERDARMGFMRAIAEMMTASAPVVQQSPGAGIYFLKMISWAASSFRTGRTIEGILDQAIAALTQQAQQPPAPPPPDPKTVSEIKKNDSQSVLNIAKAEETKINALTALMNPPGPDSKSSSV